MQYSHPQLYCFRHFHCLFFHHSLTSSKFQDQSFGQLLLFSWLVNPWIFFLLLLLLHFHIFLDKFYWQCWYWYNVNWYHSQLHPECTGMSSSASLSSSLLFTILLLPMVVEVALCSIVSLINSMLLNHFHLIPLTDPEPDGRFWLLTFSEKVSLNPFHFTWHAATNKKQQIMSTSQSTW